MAPRNERRPSSSPDSSSGATPTISSARSKNSSRFGASRAADVAVMRTAADAVAVHHLAVLAQHRERALDGVGARRPVRVDALARAG